MIAVAWWVVALALGHACAPTRVTRHRRRRSPVLLALVPRWLALVRLRRNFRRGAEWVLFALILVWAADIGAFFVGGASAGARSRRASRRQDLGRRARRRCIGGAWSRGWRQRWFRRARSCRSCRCALRWSRSRSSAISPRACSSGSRASRTAAASVPGPRRRDGSHRQRDGRRARRCVFGLLLPGGHRMIGVAVLGSTGSIGESTLDVLARHPDRFRVVALGAHQQRGEACRSRSRSVRPDSRCSPIRRGGRASSTSALRGPASRHACARRRRTALIESRDACPKSHVRDGGHRRRRRPALDARRRARRQAPVARQQGIAGDGGAAAHAARCVPRARRCCRSTASTTRSSSACRASTRARRSAAGVRRVLLTASGGPFLDWPRERLDDVHARRRPARIPNWVMGRKISVDSATLMNKGLELIEACAAVRARPGAGRGRGASAEHRAFAGRVRRRLGAGAARLAGHAHAHRPCAGVAGAVASGVQSLDLIRTARLDFERAGSSSASRAWRWRRRRRGPAGCARPCSMRRTRWPCRRFSTGA